MKKIILIFILTAAALSSNAQVQSEDFGRIILNTYLPDKISLPSEAKSLLVTKLNQMTSNNGMGGSPTNPRFIITADINIGTKDIIAGPPQLFAQNIEVTLFVGDAITNSIFSNTTLNLKGVGTNENKAFIEAFKTINPKNKEISTLLDEGKDKIINYYNQNCDIIIKEAQTLVNQEKYDEAIYNLSLVPDVCKDCYYKSLDKLTLIYQQKIDSDCTLKYNEAKITWATTQSSVGAEKAGDILSEINPLANCQTDVTLFIKLIGDKLKEDEKVRWQFKMKQYSDKIALQKEQIRIAEEEGKRNDIYRENQSSRNFELDKIHSNHSRQIAIEYLRTQPATFFYYDFYWR